MYSWALHEALGALGYNDENYELSAMSGGSTVVDGGGDAVIIELKQ